MRFGAIADDVTGGTDLASVLRRAGADVVHLLEVPAGPVPGADALVISLKTRTAPVHEAVSLASSALRALERVGAEQIYFKYCSTFDSTSEGNIGPVLDELLDRTRSAFTIACPAYPTMARAVFRGHLFVGDELLSDSSMRHHPLTPMTDANLIRVLGRQSRSTIGLVPLEVVEAGAAAVRAAFDRLAAAGHTIAIVDALFDRHIHTLADASIDLKLASGGAALGGALYQARSGAPPPLRPSRSSRGSASGPVAILSGSCSAATLGQVAQIDSALPTLYLDPIAVTEGLQSVHDVADWCRQVARTGTDLMVVSTATADALEEVRTRVGRVEAAEVIESAFRVVASALAEAGVRTFVVAGGETSGAVLQALGVSAMRLGDEIEPGVPWAETIAPEGFRLALKSGNFGSPRFFAKALGEAHGGR